MREAKDDGAWFAPKRIGYGAGLPIAWQGWVLLAGHTAIMVGGAWQFQHRPEVVLVWLLLTSVLPLPLYAAKTRGGWKWRGPGKS
ncbi:MAG: hypothetical protein GXC70_07540 [Sphingomonadaceae bacterium]|nr:hypothetical protein [Sphingomonadaceae bacterium]